MSPINVGIYLFSLFVASIEGFDFTLSHPTPDATLQSNARKVCAVLQCTESLRVVDRPRDERNQTRQVSSLSVYKALVGGDGMTREGWKMVASLTPRDVSLDRVSDAMKISGELGDQQATMSVQMFKTEDCADSQFSCVAVSTDSKGRVSVKKALVGKNVNSQSDLNLPQVQTDKVDDGMGSVSSKSLPGAAPVLMQFLGLKLDLVRSNLVGSLRSLENRLEDKVGDLRTAVEGEISEARRSVETKFGALDVKLDSLQNRLEDKVVRFDRRVTQALGQILPSDSKDTSVCDGLATRLDRIENKLTENRKQLDAFVNEITMLTNANANVTGTIVEDLASSTQELKNLKEDISTFGYQLTNLQTLTDQCASTLTSQNNVLTNLVSNAASLTQNTNDLMSKLDAFKNNYAGGSLVPVDEYFDVLGTGKKEWRLVFRGTPFIDVKIYPAYMHGTGIPIEVEEGCKQFNRSLPCTNHYRNKNAFDNWAGIDKVMFAVIRGERVAHRVIFNGKGSSISNWFSPGLILDSSWVDLSASTHTVFSIAGEVTASVQRRFFMNFDYDRGCAGFRGWFYAGDLHGGCASDRTLAVPIFRYAIGDKMAAYASAGSEVADAIGIFVKYE